jgi:gluconolactonase
MLLTHAAGAQAPPSLVAPGARVEKLAGDFKFTEGPAVDSKGNVYFSDIPNNRIHRWSLDGKLSTFREKSGGANGLFFDAKGNLIACEGGNRRVTSIAPDGTVTVLAYKYDDRKLNSPNDLCVYFTDPRYGSKDGVEQDGYHVYYISADRKQVTRVVGDMKMPNGVLGTRDGKLLYVADPGDRKTYVYRIEGPGKLAGKKLFAEQGSDGMTLDEKGNLYLTGNGVNVYSPEGKRIETIMVPEGPANLCFGGADGKTLFITARTSLYAVKMNVRGQH